MRLDDSRIRKERVADSKISRYVWMGPKSTGLKFCRVDVVQELHIVIMVMMSPQQHTRYQTSTFLKLKMPYLMLQSLTYFLQRVLCNVHISSHSLNEQQDQITLNGNSDFPL